MAYRPETFSREANMPSMYKDREQCIGIRGWFDIVVYWPKECPRDWPKKDPCDRPKDPCDEPNEVPYERPRRDPRD